MDDEELEINLNKGINLNELRRFYREMNKIRLPAVIDDLLENNTITIPQNVNYIGEYLKNEMYKWKRNDIVFLNAGTGTGKTSFIKMVCETRQVNVLILTNRVANRKQIENDLDFLLYYPRRVNVLSYQALETSGNRYVQVLENYDFIFMDESHYFTKDNTFNTMTNCSYNKLMTMKSKRAIRVFMSATNESIVKHGITTYANFSGNLTYDQLKKHVWIYEMKKNKSYISEIKKFYEFSEIIDEINISKEKWLIFVSSYETGVEYMKLILNKTKKSVAFLNRENIDNEEETAKKVLESLINYSIFEEDILLATSIIDNGVNIIDKNLKNIVIFSNEFSETIQELGRKRCMDLEDNFVLYLPNETKRSLSGQLRNKQNKLKYFRQIRRKIEGRYLFDAKVLKNGKKYDKYREAIYLEWSDMSLKPNYLGITNLYNEIKNLEKMLSSEDPFMKKVNLICSKLNNQPLIEDNIKRFLNCITNYLDIEIRKDDIDTRKYISNYFMKNIYKGKNDKINRHFGLNKLQNRFNEFNVPVDIVLSGETYKLKNTIGVKKVLLWVLF